MTNQMARDEFTVFAENTRLRTARHNLEKKIRELEAENKAQKELIDNIYASINAGDLLDPKIRKIGDLIFQFRTKNEVKKMKLSDFKIYAVGEHDWVMTRNREDAISIGMEMFGYSEEKQLLDDVVVEEVPEENLKTLKFYPDMINTGMSGEYISFKEQMEKVFNEAVAKDEDPSGLFASSEV